MSGVDRAQILHLVSDDMRPQLGCYGHTFMKTPHLDELSATGLHFDFAYTNFAYCAPSVRPPPAPSLQHLNSLLVRTDGLFATLHSATRSCLGEGRTAHER
eukprot:COSAG02_NODE_16838_length_1052_cov_1.209864_2_plen_101_part_00